MATKYPYMAWVEGDITRLADVHHLLGGPASFDVAIDKGTTPPSPPTRPQSRSDPRPRKQAQWTHSWPKRAASGTPQTAYAPPSPPKSTASSRTFPPLPPPLHYSTLTYSTPSLLKPKTGRFIYLTFGQPHFRRPHLLRDQWHIETRTIGDMFHYYLYIGRML